MVKAGTENRKKIKHQLQILLIIFLLLIIGFLIGFFLADYISSLVESERSTGEILLVIGSILTSIYTAVFLQIILHEAGHLLFGWMTGYQFLSFRIGSFIWLKKDEGIKFGRFKLAGTAGQCLMQPPNMKNGRIPYVLYNLGGSIINIFSAAISIILFFTCSNNQFLAILFILIAVVGIIFGLLNGIPLQLGQVNNDGYNALSLGKNLEAMRAFWIQLKVSEQIAKGVRLKDMPDEWFTLPSPKSLKNAVIAVIGVFACNRMMDAGELEKADEAMVKLLQIDTGIVDLHRCLLVVDQIYCELVNKNRRECLDKLLTKHQKKFMQSMKSFPSVLRTKYTYALLKEKDENQASNIKSAFDKIARNYPYPQEIVSEQELMEYAEEIYKNSC